MNWLEKKHLTLKSTIFLLVFFFSSTVKSGPPPYPQDLGTPNILEPILTIGGVYGSELGQFNEPHGVDISDSGQILITDTHNNRICIINPKFQMLNCVKPQKKTEQLNSPMNAKWLSSNQFLVADTGNKRILKLDTNGNILNSTKQNLELNISEPTGLATIDHRIYASDKSNQKVYIFDKDLQLIKSFGVAGDGDGQFVDPSSIATNGRDRLYVADSYNNRIQVFDVDGNFIRKFGDWGSFTGLLANPTSVSYSNNIIFVADLINHRVQGFDEKGNYVLQWGRHPIINHEGNGRLHYPEQIAVSKDGGLAIVCEPFEHRCQVFDILKSTKVVKVDDKAWWDKNGRFHYGARPVASAGLLAISEPDTHSVLVFDIREQTPRFIARVGGQGRDLGSMVKPSGVAISSDGSTLYVSDSGNFRL